MRKRRWLFLGGLAVLAAVAVSLKWRVDEAVGQPQAGRTIDTSLVSLRIQLGLGDRENTRWDGSIDVSGGRITALEIWRKSPQDSVDGNAWKVGSRPAPRFASRASRGKAVPPSENGVLVTLASADDDSEIRITTAQGKFAFKLSDVPLGKRLMVLGGRADVSRIPTSFQLTAAPTEEDYPAAAVAPDGTVYVSYVAFTHGADFASRYTFGDEEPEELPPLDQPTGGDQVLVVTIKDGRSSPPMPVTRGGGDIYKTAIATDGQGRPIVFWSEQVDGDFDLYASSLEGKQWSRPQRLTRGAGTDTNPVATTDAQGRVWIAWQAFRGDNSDILAMRQDGDGFTSPLPVAAHSADDWEPAIAASSQGDIAVAWDSYANGNYDVFCRVARKGEQFGSIVPVAASLNQEAHAAAAYDAQGRLWLAWEEGPERWGKDFGALVKEQGNPLYGGGQREVRVKCFQGDQPSVTAADLAATIFDQDRLTAAKKGGAKAASKAGGQVSGQKKQSAGTAAKLAREAGEERQSQVGIPHSLPRLAVDRGGRVWLAYRSRSPHFWSGVGTAWFEHLSCYAGDRWLEPVYVHHTDNILDNRPALVALGNGQMLLVNSSDSRQSISSNPRGQAAAAPSGGKADPVNNDIFLSAFGLPKQSAQTPSLSAAEPVVPAKPVGGAEKAAIARCREYRLDIAGKSLQLMRGEFHRHTEYSSDGGGDGTLIDMYRYALDAADMDWIGNGDHDNGGGREYSWWITQKTADVFRAGERFTPVYSYERSVSYPDGHRNVVFPVRGIRTLPRFGKPGTGSDDQQPAHTPDTLLLYRYLEQFDGICASHTSGTDMGTDWRDNNPKVEPVVEIYQGCRQNYEEPGAPRAPSENDAIGGWRPNGFVWRALAKGYRLGFQASSDHTSTHISYCNVWAEERTRQGIFEALKKRHVFGATDNIIADVRCGEQMMGDEFTLAGPPTLRVKLVGTAPFARVDIVKDNTYVYNLTPGKQEVEFTWTDMEPGQGTSYYYVRGEQEDGQLVWVSPMWITFKK